MLYQEPMSSDRTAFFRGDPEEEVKPAATKPKPTVKAKRQAVMEFF